MRLIFRWDQCGKYDIPAMIDHVLNTTRQEKIHYVGHSMGTTAFMVTMNLRPGTRYANLKH
jgi:lysosomal acid lipase/cholesteryl ester hydrolase